MKFQFFGSFLLIAIIGFGQQRFECFLTAFALAGVVVEVVVVGEGHGAMVSPSHGADTTLCAPAGTAEEISVSAPQVAVSRR